MYGYLFSSGKLNIKGIVCWRYFSTPRIFLSCQRNSTTVFHLLSACTVMVWCNDKEFINYTSDFKFKSGHEFLIKTCDSLVKDYVHVRAQQRNGSKSLITVQGWKREYSYSKILKDLNKEFCCNGTVVQDPELGQVIQLQTLSLAKNFVYLGAMNETFSFALCEQSGIVKNDNIKIHGF